MKVDGLPMLSLAKKATRMNRGGNLNAALGPRCPGSFDMSFLAMSDDECQIYLMLPLGLTDYWAMFV